MRCHTAPNPAGRAQCGPLRAAWWPVRSVQSRAWRPVCQAGSGVEQNLAALQHSQALAAARAAELLRADRLVWDPWAPALAALDAALLPKVNPFDLGGAAADDPAGADDGASTGGGAAPAGVREPASGAAAAAALAAASPARGGDPAAASEPPPPPLSREQMLDVLATRHIDEALLNALAATNVNRIEGGDYRQLVLLGDGLDTRPFRLPLPAGTLVFIVAPPEVHAQAEAVLGSGAKAAARVPRGCLLRRVPLPAPAAGDGADSVGLEEALGAAGYRGDKLSVWAMQGLQGLQLGRGQLGELLAQATNCAAFHSLVVGELPGCPHRGDADNLLAECGLLGALCAPGEGDAGGVEAGQGGGSEGPHARWDVGRWGRPGGEGRWLFGAQQLRLSLEQMGIYQRHVDAQVEEDFGDAHFS